MYSLKYNAWYKIPPLSLRGIHQKNFNNKNKHYSISSWDLTLLCVKISFTFTVVKRTFTYTAVITILTYAVKKNSYISFTVGWKTISLLKPFTLLCKTILHSLIFQLASLRFNNQKNYTLTCWEILPVLAFYALLCFFLHIIKSTNNYIGLFLTLLRSFYFILFTIKIVIPRCPVPSVFALLCVLPSLHICHSIFNQKY